MVKYFAIRRSLLFEKTLFDELRDGLCNFRRPLSDAGVEHPPMKDAVDRVLCIRMPGQIIENFWRRRWKSWVGEHTFGVSHPPVAIDVPRNFRCCARTQLCAFSARPRVSIPPLKMRSPRRSLSALERESALDSRTPVRTILSYHLGKYSPPISR